MLPRIYLLGIRSGEKFVTLTKNEDFALADKLSALPNNGRFLHPQV
jgi:hypothetical protein